MLPLIIVGAIAYSWHKNNQKEQRRAKLAKDKADFLSKWFSPKAIIPPIAGTISFLKLFLDEYLTKILDLSIIIQFSILIIALFFLFSLIDIITLAINIGTKVGPCGHSFHSLDEEIGYFLFFIFSAVIYYIRNCFYN